MATRLAAFNSGLELRGFLEANKNLEKVLVVGSGSNLLFTKDYDGFVLLNEIKGVKIIAESDSEVIVKVGGGENWSDFVDYTISKGWGGLENLSLIPGTVGAAPVQNIGAYGVELNEVLVSLEAIDIETGDTLAFANEDCEFEYRTSIFKTRLKGRFVILNVLFRLMKTPELTLDYAPLKKYFSDREKDSISIREVGEAVKQIRRSKLPDPDEIGNAGSFFKNPVVRFSKIEELMSKFPDIPFYKVDDGNFKLAAGWLIEKSGWKGKRIGDAGVHNKQALVLVNYGKASGKDIADLAIQVQNSVKDQFGIALETEVTIL